MEEETSSKPRAIKWIDEGSEKNEKKNALVTNKSSEDLSHKVVGNLTPIETHKDEQKRLSMKSAIKPFKLDLNKLTGLRNFTEISPDPLALPHYALPGGR